MTREQHYEMSQDHGRKATEALDTMIELQNKGKWTESWKYWEVYRFESNLERKHFGIYRAALKRWLRRNSLLLD